jgi:putative transposase
MRRAFKYRMRPNVNQTRELEIALETHRRLYNSCLEGRKAAWEQERRSVGFMEQRQDYIDHYRENPFYARLNANSAHATIKRLDLAFAAFFRRVKEYKAAKARGQKPKAKPGYPRFKGRDRFDSIPFGTYPNGVKLDGDRLRVQHVGTIKVRAPPPVEGTIKTVTLKREADKWYVVFSCDLGDVAIQPARTRRSASTWACRRS